jgi:hypothetical protein
LSSLEKGFGEEAESGCQLSSRVAPSSSLLVPKGPFDDASHPGHLPIVAVVPIAPNVWILIQV